MWPALIILIAIILLVLTMIIAKWLSFTVDAYFTISLAFLVFMLVNAFFIYVWYWVGKWLYYIIIHAKSFVQKSVDWVLKVFE